MLATIDCDIRAGHEGGLVGGEIDDQSRDLFGFAQSTYGDLRNNLAIQDLLWNRRYHFGADIARRDGIDRYSLPRHFERERFGETMHARFRCRVVRLTESALGAVHRGDVD